MSKETGVAKNVHYGDVLIKYGEVLDVSKAKLPMISDESILTKYRTSFLQNGDVIVADTAEDSTVGKCSEIAGLIDEVVLSGLHTIPYRPVEKFASGYLGYYLNSDAYHHQLIPLMQGIKVTSISKSAMQDTGIIYPKLTEEQAKIGTYFQSLDHLITLHQRKCEETKSLKKYMLQKMFPENGKCVPKIRFSGFSDDWEQRKLGNVIEELKSGLSRQLDNADIGLPVVRANNISDGKLDMNNDVKYWYKDDPQGADTRNYLIHKNDILINFINSESKMGTATIVDTEPDRDTIYTTNILKMKVDNTVSDSLFLLYLTMTYHYCNYIKSITKPAVNQASFTTVDYKNYSFMMPLLEEQKKIGIYLNKIDHLITLHQHKCDELQKLKKFMLQNMFV